MKPVRTSFTETPYKGIDPNIGDLWTHIDDEGAVWAVFEPEGDELELLNQGGRVILRVMAQPLPPVALGVFSEEETRPVAPHPYKIIPELEERDGPSPGY